MEITDFNEKNEVQFILNKLKKFMSDTNSKEAKQKIDPFISFIKTNPIKEDFKKFLNKLFSKRFLKKYNKNQELENFFNEILSLKQKDFIKNYLKDENLEVDDIDEFLEVSKSAIFHNNKEDYDEMKTFFNDESFMLFEKHLSLVIDDIKHSENFSKNKEENFCDKILNIEEKFSDENIETKEKKPIKKIAEHKKQSFNKIIKKKSDDSFEKIEKEDNSFEKIEKEDELSKSKIGNYLEEVETAEQLESKFFHQIDVFVELNEEFEEILFEIDLKELYNIYLKNDEKVLKQKIRKLLEGKDMKYCLKKKFLLFLLNSKNNNLSSKYEKKNIKKKIKKNEKKKSSNSIIHEINYNLENINKKIKTFILFKTFKDSGSEYKMLKNKINYKRALEIKNYIKSENITTRSFYGDLNNCLLKSKKFFKSNFNFDNLNFDPVNCSIIGITDGEDKFAFVLICDMSYFNKLYIKDNFISEFIRFLLDLSEIVEFCPNNEFVVNELKDEFRNPFVQTVGNPIQAKEIVLKNSDHFHLKNINLENENFNEKIHMISNSSFLWRFKFINSEKIFQRKKILINKYELGITSLFWNNDKYINYNYSSFYRVVEKYFRNSDVILEDYFETLFRYLKNFVNNENRNKFKEEINKIKNQFFEDEKLFYKYIDYSKKKIGINYIIFEEVYTEDLKEKIDNSEEKIDNSEEKIENSKEKIENLKEKIENSKEKIETKDSKKMKKNFVKIIYKNIKSKKYKDYIIEKILKISKKYCSDFYLEKRLKLKMDFYNLKIIRNDGSEINGSKIIKLIHNIDKEFITSSHNISIHSMFFLNENKINFFFLKNYPKNRSTLFKTEINKYSCELSTVFISSYDDNLYINNSAKLWIIYNNREEKFSIGKIDKKFKLVNETTKNIYGRVKNDSKIEKIISLTIFTSIEKIIFINQDYKIFVYNYSYNLNDDLDILYKKENNGGSSVTKSELKPENKSEKYFCVKSSLTSKIFFLQSESSLDIYDISLVCLMRYKLQEDFINFETFKNNQSEILFIKNKNSFQCYNIVGIETQIRIDFEHERNEENIIFNSCLDYLYLAKNKYGPHSSYIGSPNKTNLIFSSTNEKNFINLNEYYNTLNLKNINLINSDKYLKEKKLKKQILFNIIFSRIPIHAATLENFKLIPLKDGKNNYNEIMEELKGNFPPHKLIDIISKKTSFSYYEDILNNWKDEIYVVSIVGRQSSGKSYLLNRLFGTRFNVAANRCTDGIWISTSIVKNDEGKDMLIFVIDCEGLFSIRRNSEDELKMILALTSISDILLLNNDLTFNRNLQQMFETIKRVYGKLKSNKLFKSKLFMMLRDVPYDEMNEAHKEFMGFINQTTIKENNFLKMVFVELPRCWCIIHFKNSLFEEYTKKIRKDILNNLSTVKRWKNGTDFLESFKIVLAQILIEDDTNMDKHKIKLKCEKAFNEYLDYFFFNPNFYKKLESKFKFDNDDIKFEINHYDLDFSCIKDAINENEINEDKNVGEDKIFKKVKLSTNNLEYNKIKEDSFKNEVSLLSEEFSEDDNLKDKNTIKNDENDEKYENDEDDKDSIKEDFENFDSHNENKNSEKIINDEDSDEEKSNESLEKTEKLNKEKNKISDEKYINKAICYFLNIFQSNFENYSKETHNKWYKNFKLFCESIIASRSEIILNQFEIELPDDENEDFSEEIDKIKKKLFRQLDKLPYFINFCKKTCRNCLRECTKQKDHLDNCNCSTDHLCTSFCETTETCIQNKFICKKLFGHKENHLCIKGNHSCNNKCNIEGCSYDCTLKSNHIELKHDCGNKHPCEYICCVKECKRSCFLDKKHDHEIHNCGENICINKCELCHNSCGFTDHFHNKLIQDDNLEKLEIDVDGEIKVIKNHLCGKEHDCKILCENKGVCNVGYDPIEKLWKNKHNEIPYIYFRPKNSQEVCNLKIPKFEKDHKKIHDCGQKKHRCNIQCPECKSFCNKDTNHIGLHHSNNHRNKELCVFATTEDTDVIELEKNGKIKKFLVGDNCEPITCHGSCKKKGRAHYHIKECPGGDDCPAKMNDNIKHSDKKFAPFFDKTYDMYLCRNYWNSYNWHEPIEEDEESGLCNYYCGHPKHDDEISYCNKNAWHKDSHKFDCDHKKDYFNNQIDVGFVVDTTGSMQSYILKTKEAIKRVVDEFNKKISDDDDKKDFKFSFVGYRDHPPQDYTYVTKEKDFTTSTECINFINTISAGGGGDTPEAVLDGLNHMMKLSWREKSSKYLFHIADAPPHGKRYISSGDGFPEGCPCHLKIEDIADKMNNKNIKYKLMKIGTLVNKMSDVFGGMIDNFEKCELDCAIQIEENVVEIMHRDFTSFEIAF